MQPIKLLKAAAVSTLVVITTSALGAQGIVSETTIKAQKSLTSNHKLSNGLPVVLRQIPGSDILEIEVTMAGGLRDLPTGQKSLNKWLFATMPMSAEGYPKEKVFELTEKYALALSCSGGIESSSCSVGTVNEYWGMALPLLAAIVQKPALTDADVKLQKDRIVAMLKSVPQEPGDYVNELVNSIYYPPGHAYRLNHDEALPEMEKLGRADLAAYHQKILNATQMHIVVASSMSPGKVLGDLERAFGKVPKAVAAPVAAVSPEFTSSKAFIFEDREIPTAYIRGKFNAPSIQEKDAVAAKLLFEILNEELGDEIRTRRSLSYSVYAFAIQYTRGIGVIGASTSKPEETLEAMNLVIQKLKSHDYSEAEIAQYKNVFATHYYLTQETHGSLADAIGTSVLYYGSADKLYEFPRELDQIKSADIKRLANQILVDFRLGVIYNRKAFKDEWANALISKNLSKKSE